MLKNYFLDEYITVFCFFIPLAGDGLGQAGCPMGLAGWDHAGTPRSDGAAGSAGC